MCKIVTKDSKGLIIRKSLESVSVKLERVTEFGVYESGIRRSQRISLKSVRGTSQAILPFNIK